MAAPSLASRRALGRTKLQLPPFGFGTAGVMFGGSRRAAGDGAHRTSIGFRLPTDAEASAAFQAAWDGGMRFYDTAPYYGRGQAEVRAGRFLYDRPREEYVLQTKVGRVLRRRAKHRQVPDYHAGGSAQTYAGQTAAMGIPEGAHGMLPFEILHDYTYTGIMRSFEDSLQRLSVDRVDALVIHDLDRMFFTDDLIDHHFRELREGGWRALEELRRTGEVQAVGAGVNHCGTMGRYLDSIPVDYFMVAQVYSLLHQTGRATAMCDEKGLQRGGPLAELERSAQLGVGAVACSPFNAGILAVGPRADGTDICNYRPATPDEVSRAARLDVACREHGVPLGAAALQFPLAHPAVASVVFGIGSEQEARTGLEWATMALPPELWRDIRERGLVEEGTPLPGGA